MKNFLIVFLFTFFSVSNAYANCSYPDDPQLQAQKEACPQQFGKTWSCERNACVFTQETVDLRNENDQQLDKCNELETEDEKKACFDSFAKEKAGRLEKGEDVKPGILFAATVLGAAVFFKGSKSSACTSAKIAGATGAAAIVGHFLQKNKLKKDSKKLVEKYQSETVDKNAHDGQIKAFQFLKEQQDLVAKHASKKKKLYAVQALGYTAAAAYAGVELAGIFGVTCASGYEKTKDSTENNEQQTETNEEVAATDATTDATTDTTTDATTDATTDTTTDATTGDTEVEVTNLPPPEVAPTGNAAARNAPTPAQNNVQAAPSDSCAATPAPVITPLNPVINPFDVSVLVPGILAGIPGVETPSSFPSPCKINTSRHKKLIDFLIRKSIANDTTIIQKAKNYLKPIEESIGSVVGHPLFTLGVGTVSALWANKLRSDAADEENNAKDRSKAIAEIMRAFSASLSGFCPEGRENLREPRCFCFLKDGSRNPERTRSQTCRNVFEQDDINFAVGSTDYTKEEVTENKKGCVRIDGAFDENCRCRKLKNEDGENACLKVSTPTINLPGGIAQQVGVSSAANLIDSLNSGNTNLGSIDFQGVNNQAAKINDRFSKIRRKVNSKKETIPDVPSGLSDKLLSDIVSPKLASQVEANLAKTNINNARPSNLNLEQSLDQASKKIGKSDKNLKSILQFNTGVKKANQAAKKKGFRFNFDDDSTSGKNVVNLDSAMKKKYKYRQNDINKSSRSIWNIISNRYNQTGLKKLFQNE